MNVKHWALFFVVTLSVNYVSATFLPFGGSRHRGRRISYDDWNDCNEDLHGFLNGKIRGLRRTFQSKYGGECELGDRELDSYTLRNIRAKGIGRFGLGDTCQYNYVDGVGFLRFAISFEKIIASFALAIPEAAGGIIAKFAETIFGIIGSWIDKFLQIAFPSFLCDIVLKGDYDSGFSLHDFNIPKPRGGIDFLGDLAGHGNSLGSFKSLLFEPFFYVIHLFLNNHFRPLVEDEIEDWSFDDLFGSSGFGLGLGGKHKRSRSGRGSLRGGLEDEDEVHGGLVSGGKRGHGGRRGGSVSGEERGHGGKYGHGGRNGGSVTDGEGGHRGSSGGSKFGGKYGYEGRYGGSVSDRVPGHGRRSGGSKYGGRTDEDEDEDEDEDSENEGSTGNGNSYEYRESYSYGYGDDEEGY